MTLCRNCAAIADRAGQARPRAADLARGALFGLGAAVAASLVWCGIAAISHYPLDEFAVVLGWLVSVMVVRGAGRKYGLLLQFISLAIVVICTIGSETFIWRFLATIPPWTGTRYEKVPMFYLWVGAAVAFVIPARPGPRRAVWRR